MSKRKAASFTNVELSSAHAVKVLLCYLLDRLNRAVTEKQLLEIALDSEVVNYFFYAEALDDLLKTGAVSRKNVDGEDVLILEEKGKMGSDYFNLYIPHYFRKRLLTAALEYFAKLKRESEVKCDITETDNGYEISCVIKDASYDLLRISLYAPDIDQAEIIKNKIMLNPARLYEKIVGYTLANEEEAIDADSKM